MSAQFVSYGNSFQKLNCGWKIEEASVRHWSENEIEWWYAIIKWYTVKRGYPWHSTVHWYTKNSIVYRGRVIGKR